MNNISIEPVKDSSINWKKNVFFICLTQFLSAVGFALAHPLIAFFIRQRWGIYNETELASWTSSFWFFSMLSVFLFTPIWGFLADRYGRKLMLLRACYADAILYPCFLLVPNPYWLIAVRFVASAFCGSCAASQALVVSTTPRNHHGFAVGALYAMLFCGNLIGFAAGGLIVHYCGYTVTFIVCSLLYLLGGALAHINIVDNFQTVSKNAELEKNVPCQRKNVVFSFSVLMIFSLILITAIAFKFDTPYTALMIEHVNGSNNSDLYTGMVSAIAALGGMISGMLSGKLCDKFSPKRLMIPVLVTSGFAAILQSLTITLNDYIGCRFLFFFFSGGIEAICISILSRATHPSRHGTVLALANSVKTGGHLLAAALSGLVICHWGIHAVYLSTGVIFFMTIPLFLFISSDYKKRKEENINADAISQNCES